MIQRMVLGVLGGALIALSVFTVGNSVAFDSGVPDAGSAWVVLTAGAVVALFSIVGVRTLIGFGAGAAAAVAATEIIDAARAGDFTVTARLVVVAAGILAALAATTGRRRAKVVAEPEPVVVAPVVAAPVEPERVVATPAVVTPVVVTPVVVTPVVAAPVAGTSEAIVVPAKRAKSRVTKASAEHETTKANIPR